MTVSLTHDSPHLQDKVAILKEEAELLRSIRDQLTETNISLQSENDQLLQDNKLSEVQKAVCIYKSQKLEFKVARYEAEKLSSDMIEDISIFDIEIVSTNEAITLKMYEISEFERKQYASAVRRLSVALRESVAECRQLKSDMKDIQDESKAAEAETRQQYNQLLSEKSKLKEMLKSAKDGILEAQSAESQRNEKIYELETEIEILKQQLNEYHEKKLDRKLRQSETQLKDALRINKDLQMQLERLNEITSENSELKAELKRLKFTQCVSLDEPIGRIRSAISTCDEALKRRPISRQTAHVASASNANREQENQKSQLQDKVFEEDVHSDESDKAAQLKDPNWSDFEQNPGRKNKKTPKKRKQQAQLDTDSVPVLRPVTNSNQPRKLFAERAKSKMFTNSPGLSSVDHTFTDMLQISGSVASIKDKSKRSRTRAFQKLDITS